MTDVAIVQLASWGDVIISTVLPRAIKEQRPDWKITYYTSSACAGAIIHNPDIDNLKIIPATKEQAWGMQDKIIAQARRDHQKVYTPWAGFYKQEDWLPLSKPGWDGEYHHNFMWAYARTAQLDGLTVPNPLKIYLHPAPDEIAKAEQHYDKNFLTGRTKVLMEVEGHSGQSWMRQSWIAPIMEVLTAKYGEVDLAISKGGSETPEIHAAKMRWPGQIYMLNTLSLREVAAMFNGFDIFIGCSSGTSNACHAHFCKSDIQWFETVKSTVWDSRPLRPTGKNIYYGEEPRGFFDLLRDNLR